jgi:hypothetical protein
VDLVETAMIQQVPQAVVGAVPDQVLMASVLVVAVTAEAAQPLLLVVLRQHHFQWPLVEVVGVVVVLTDMVPVVAVVLAQGTVHHHILMQLQAVVEHPIVVVELEVVVDLVAVAALEDLVSFI